MLPVGTSGTETRPEGTGEHRHSSPRRHRRAPRDPIRPSGCKFRAMPQSFFGPVHKPCNELGGRPPGKQIRNTTNLGHIPSSHRISRQLTNYIPAFAEQHGHNDLVKRLASKAIDWLT